MHAPATPFEPERLLPVLRDLPASGTWWVAFSGGADSTALLHALTRLHDQYPVRLKALHIDHGLHSASRAWSRHCVEVCRRLDVPLETRRVEIDPAPGQSLEAEARRLRYAAAAELVREGDVLLTGHHADDQAETVLLNLMRGSGIDGLAGMPRTRPFGRGTLARPLLSFSGGSLRHYLAQAGLDWIEDSSNQDHGFDRNFIRHALRPMLEKRWPGAWRNLVQSAEHCRDASDFLAHACDGMLQPCIARKGLLDLECLRSRLTAEAGPDALNFLLRQWLKNEGASSMPRARLQEFLRQCAQAGPDSHVAAEWEEWVLHRYQDRLWLQRQCDIVCCPALDWSGAEPLELGGALGRLRYTGPPPARPFQVKPRQGGEKIADLAGGRHRSLKQLLQQARVPPWLRPSIPVIWLEGAVVAVPGLAAAGTLSTDRARISWEPRDPVLQQLVSQWADARG